jgi:DNA-binding XRE family transcriptional regulator
MTNAARKKAQEHRNRRVRQIDRDAWKQERYVRMRRSVNFASAAKATRTALEVTQAEVAEALDLSLASIVNRENGFHAWSGGQEELAAYQRTCMKIAGV